MDKCHLQLTSRNSGNYFLCQICAFSETAKDISGRSSEGKPVLTVFLEGESHHTTGTIATMVMVTLYFYYHLKYPLILADYYVSRHLFKSHYIERENVIISY